MIKRIYLETVMNKRIYLETVMNKRIYHTSHRHPVHRKTYHWTSGSDTAEVTLCYTLLTQKFRCETLFVK